MTTNLRQRMTEDMQVRNLSPLTQSTYVLRIPTKAATYSNLIAATIPT
jgi:hypothetical protein